MACADRTCGSCGAAGVVTVLDSAESFQAKFGQDLDEVVAVQTSAAPPAGSPVRIECGDLTVLGEIVTADGTVAHVYVEHVLNCAAIGGRAFSRAARRATASGQG